jgi:hypothetical protein
MNAVAKLAGVSRSTIVNARGDLAKQARKQTRKTGQPATPASPVPEPRQRAQRFLLDALAHGPKQVSDVEAAAVKARVDQHSLERARAELGIVVGRANTGGPQ